MPFPGILGGFETRQKQFFAYFWSQEKNQKKIFSRKNRFLSVKIGFFGEKSVFIGKNRFLSEKSAIFRRFFFFSDFSTAKSFPGPPKSDFSPKNRPISAIFLSLLSTCSYEVVCEGECWRA